MYDAIVVGARCAGAPTAMLLARKGYRVLLVDRATFPSDTMSSHYIHLYGTLRLHRWGLLERVIATGCPPITRLTSDWRHLRLTGTPPPLEGVQIGLCPRRYALDKVLVDAAVEAGADLQEGFFVEEVTTDGERVTGIRGRISGGRSVEVNAPLTIGADGMRSLVARTVEPEEYNTVPSLTTTFYTYFSGLELDELLIHRMPHRVVPAIPTNDGLTCVLCGWHYDEFREYRSDIQGNFMKTMELIPEFAERIRAARREERFVGTHNVPNFYRKPYGPGWALVGDAGYHKDPVSALGISDAFRDVELLVDAIDDAFSGRRPIDEAMADYEQTRNVESAPLYQMTLQQAMMQPPPPEIQAIMVALQDDEEQRNRFFGILAGSVAFSDFFAPENVAAIMERAGAPQPAPAG